MFEYHGCAEGLKKELDTYGSALEEAYREAVGIHFRRLVDEERRLVSPETFGSYEDAPGIVGSEKGLPGFGAQYFIRIEANDHSDSERVEVVDSEGRFVFDGRVEFHTTPVFRFPEKAFERVIKPKLPKYLSSYVHEYNHFCLYVLQEHPTQLVSYIPYTFLQNLGYSGNSILELMAKAEKRDPHFVLLLGALTGLAEGMALRMEEIVWKKLGYSPEDIITSDFGRDLIDGNLLGEKDISDGDFVESMVRWLGNLNASDPFISNFFKTMPGHIEFYKYPFKEYGEEQNSEK
jgi:hypothetical protein